MSTQENRLDALKQLGFDDKFSAFLDLQLQSIEAEMYRVKYLDLKARQLFPLKGDVSPGAETFAFYVWDVFGEAIWAANYHNEVPSQAVRGEKIIGHIEGMLSGYHYSTQDLRAAALANLPLDSELQKQAMASLERMVDRVAALGDTARQFVGFANHPNPVVLAATGSFANPATAADSILSDLHKMAKRIRSDTKEVYSPDTILLPTDAYDAIATRPFNSGNSSNVTILEMFLKGNPWITSVQSWVRLAAAGVGSVGRAICYKKDPGVVQLVIPLEALQHEPQKRVLNYEVPIEMRFGGVLVRQPKAIVYMDGVS